MLSATTTRAVITSCNRQILRRSSCRHHDHVPPPVRRRIQMTPRDVSSRSSCEVIGIGMKRRHNQDVNNTVGFLDIDGVVQPSEMTSWSNQKLLTHDIHHSGNLIRKCRRSARPRTANCLPASFRLDDFQRLESSGYNWYGYANIHSRTFLSTTTDEDTDAKKKKEDKNSIEVVDKEFSEYLTGEMDEGNPSLDQVETRISNHPRDILEADDKKIEEKTQSTGDWFSSLLSDSSDLGRPNTEVNETYKNTEKANFRNIEKIRVKQITTVRRALGGNVIIAGSKLVAYLHSGSSAMLSEFIHSVVDCGNQSLLLVGLRDAGNEADRAHPYGYGKSIYFWALVSALGTFFLGAGVSMTQAIPQLIYGGNLHEITWSVWSVLGFSFAVDGYVFTKTLIEVREDAPKDTSLYKCISTLRDPATLAIILEDGAACLGIVMAIGGIAATQAFDMPVYDALAGVCISGLLAAMGIILVRVNHRFLLGQAVDKETMKGIERILLNRRSIDNVNSVQSQWTGPDTFSYKAEVDFDGTFLAAKLMPRYQQEFSEASATLDQDLRVLLSWYAEDVMRTVEREVRNVENEIRREYPGAQYIELEPMSKDADRFAIDDGLEASLKRIEIEALNRYLKSLYGRKK